MPTFIPEGTIKLIKNVDIDISYTHQYYFRNSDAQETFFDSKVFKTLTNGTYQRKNINSIQVPYQADEIAECKYLYWINPQYSQKRYYAFVTSINYVNPGVSQINYQLDVYQTFLFDVTWKESFIERKHTTRYNQSGIPYINTLDENLEYGTEYDVVARDTVWQNPDVAWCIIGNTNQDDSYRYGNLDSNLGYRIIPVWLGDEAKTFYIQYDASGTGTLDTYEIASLKDVFNQYRNNSSLVNTMVSCVIIPYLCVKNLDIDDRGTRVIISSPVLLPRGLSGLSTYTLALSRASHSDPYIVYEKNMGNKYQHFPQYEESKLLMYPYSFLELTTNRGDSKIIKLEYINSQNVNIGICGTVSFRNKMAFIVENYLSDGYKINNALVDNSNESVPIMDDYSASYLQANSNAIEVSKSNAQMIQQSQLDRAQNTYNTGSQNALLQRASGDVQATGNFVGGLFSSIMGNPGGVNSMIGGVADYFSTGLQYDSTMNSLENSLANNRISANTDYQTTIASTLAKVRDAEQVPASTRSLGGDYMFDNAYSCNRLYLVYKTIKSEYANKLTNYFKQYGYKVNALEIPQFDTRESWNYIKMKEPNVTGNIPMDDLLKIRDIFIKGITLWHGDYIGDYSRSNNEER